MKNRKFLISFFITSLFIFTLGVIAILKPDEDYLTTEGTIVRIEEEYDPIDEMFYERCYINYTVDGFLYNDVEYGAYDSSMKVNDKVIVYYKEEDPTLIQSKGYQNVPYIVCAISLVFLIIDVILFVKSK